MIMVKKSLFFSFLFALILLVGFVSAQFGNIEGQVDDAVGNLENNITKIKEFTEKDKWDFIGLQWKEFLLKNKFILGIDTLFTRINILFVVLLGMSWSLSLQIFFAVLLWFISLFTLSKYILFSRNNWIKFFCSLLGVVLLAQIRFFEYVSKWSVSLVLYKGSIIWRVFILIAIICLFLGLSFVFRAIASLYKKKIEMREKQKEMENRKELEGIVKATRTKV